MTRIASSGGFLRKRNVTVMIGTEDEKVETAIGIIRENSATRVQITPLMSYGGVDCCAINTAPVPRTGRSCSWSMSRGMNGFNRM